MPPFGLPNIEKLKAKEDVKGLIGALEYPRGWVARIVSKVHSDFSISLMHQRAAAALGETGDTQAVEPLIAALTDRDYAVRRRAATALGKLGDTRATESLIAALKDRDSAVRGRAAAALGKLGDARAVEPLIAASKDRDFKVRGHAAIALGKLGDTRVLDRLVSMCTDRSMGVRKQAVEAIGEIGGADAATHLVKEIEHSLTREVATKALVKIGPQAVQALIPALQSKDYSVQLCAAQVLGDIGDTRAVEPLIATLTRSGDLPAYAAEALGKIGDARAVEPLLSELGNTSIQVCDRAVKALDKLKWKPQEDEHGAAYWVAKKNWERCVAMGPLAVGPLLRRLKTDDEKLQKDVIETLERIGDPNGLRAVEQYHEAREIARQREAQDETEKQEQAGIARERQQEIPKPQSGHLLEIRFDVGKAQASNYKLAFWTVFWEAVDRDMVGDIALFEGERDSVGQGDRVFCIGVLSAEYESLDRISASMAQKANYQHVAATPPFEERESIPESFTDVGRLSGSGSFSTGSFNARSAYWRTSTRAPLFEKQIPESWRSKKAISQQELEELIPKLMLSPRSLSGLESLRPFHPEAMQAMGILSLFGDQVVDPLVMALRATESAVGIRNMVMVLGHLADSRSLIPIAGLLQHPDHEVRSEALMALYHFAEEDIRSPQVLETLREACGHHDIYLREKAAKLLESLGEQTERIPWYHGLVTWREIEDAFIELELKRGGQPDFLSLRATLESYSSRERAAVWIGVAEALYDQGRKGLSSLCYLEALRNNPDRDLIAWDWISGEYDDGMRMLRHKSQANLNEIYSRYGLFAGHT